jgi:hypothetical protein
MISKEQQEEIAKTIRKQWQFMGVTCK